MKTLTFNVYNDPGHGWIKVSKKTLVKFFGEHWRKSFTPFSYERGEYTYLEEDQDAATFIQRLKDNQIQPVWRHYYNKTRYSRIRNYSPLQPI